MGCHRVYIYEQIFITMKTNETILYQMPNGASQIEIRFENGEIWLDQYQIAMLFDTDRTSILKHIKNIYETEELEINSTCAKIAQVQMEGKRKVTRHILYYNLDLIISVGYRVNSKRGTQFRIWANKVLKDYFINGYAIQRPVSKQEFDNTIAELEQQIVNSEKFTEEQISEVYKTLADFFSRKQMEEKPRKRIGFEISKSDK